MRRPDTDFIMGPRTCGGWLNPCAQRILCAQRRMTGRYIDDTRESAESLHGTTTAPYGSEPVRYGAGGLGIEHGVDGRRRIGRATQYPHRGDVGGKGG